MAEMSYGGDLHVFPGYIPLSEQSPADQGRAYPHSSTCPRQSQAPELVPQASVSSRTLNGKSKDGNHTPGTHHTVLADVFGVGKVPQPSPDAEPPLPHYSPAHSPRASKPAQVPKAMGSKPLPDSVFWSRNPGLELGWEGSSKVESPCPCPVA